MNEIKTSRFLFAKENFIKAVNKFENPIHQKWVKTFFHFKDIELELPIVNTSDFFSRDWINPIWEEYIKTCDSFSNKSSTDSNQKYFYRFIGDLDFIFLEKIEELLIEQNAFPLEPKVNKRNENTKDKAQPSEWGWVYLIKVIDRYKIGMSTRLLGRMNDLKVFELISAVHCLNYRALEKELHSIYADYQYSGSEIFDLNQKQIKEIMILMNKKSIVEIKDTPANEEED